MCLKYFLPLKVVDSVCEAKLSALQRVRQPDSNFWDPSSTLEDSDWNLGLSINSEFIGFDFKNVAKAHLLSLH